MLLEDNWKVVILEKYCFLKSNDSESLDFLFLEEH
jgi:hypothetical protein